MKISLIAAATENNVIGRDNDLPWSLPDDMRFFVRTTKGHHVLTGRKNLESFGKLLPNRINIILTRDTDYEFEGAVIVHDLEEGIRIADRNREEELMIIGGGEIYKQALPMADRIYLTRIHTELEGDTFFPEFSLDEWHLIDSEKHEADEKHAYAFTFETYQRK
jgi:dihydrofolate reductase